MKRFVLIILLALGLTACSHFSDPYQDALVSVTVHAVYPAGHADAVREGAVVRFVDIASGSSWLTETDSRGAVTVLLPKGVYRILMSDRQGRDIYNGSQDKVVVAGEPVTVQLALEYSLAGTLVIKELYVGGCSKAPQEGTWQSDQYVLLHNNDNQTVYLDSLCFGSLHPYNSNGVNHWLQPDGSLPDFAPVVSVVWNFPGDGKTYPLAPGEDALIALRGAIDHTAEYPLSVNLNRPDCFVCYTPTYFPNPIYHPAPGDLVRQDHILEVAVKTGQSNANVVSISSPAFVIFRVQGTSIQEFLARPDVIQATPGAAADVVVKVPWDWIIDGVEVFNGGSSGNAKRLPPAVDAGYVSQSETFKGRSLMRTVDEEASAAAGFTILQDTNNSSNDFYERETASLHTGATE